MKCIACGIRHCTICGKCHQTRCKARTARCGHVLLHYPDMQKNAQKKKGEQSA